MKHDYAFVVSDHPFPVSVILFLLTLISTHAFAQRWLLVSAWRNSVIDYGKVFVLLSWLVPYIFWTGI